MPAHPWSNPKDISYQSVEIVYTKKFAFLPTKCKNDTVWLNSYYEKDTYISEGFIRAHAHGGNLSEAECIIDKLTGGF